MYIPKHRDPSLASCTLESSRTLVGYFSLSPLSPSFLSSFLSPLHILIYCRTFSSSIFSSRLQSCPSSSSSRTLVGYHSSPLPLHPSSRIFFLIFFSCFPLSRPSYSRTLVGHFSLLRILRILHSSFCALSSCFPILDSSKDHFPT